MPSVPIRLDRAFRYGYITKYVLNGANAKKSPEKNQAWIVLDGIIEHITGTLTTILKNSKQNTTFSDGWRKVILAASPSGYYNLMSTVPEDETSDVKTCQPLLNLWLLSGDDMLFISSGGAGVKLHFTVLEWSIIG